MSATMKIIPFAVSAASLDRATSVAAEGGFASRLSARFAPASSRPLCRIQNFRSQRNRFAPLKKGLWPPRVRSRLIGDCALHATETLASVLRRIEGACDLIGGSAITDRRDVVPSAIEKANGRIEHFGMPVEAGNLLLLGSLPGEGKVKPVIGAVLCSARSPKKNGFDFLLDRILARLTVGSEEVRRMGVGGLLIEAAVHVQLNAVSYEVSVE
jgi:molybdenum cofactor cytidylyltransferase